jgi:peptidoglycan/LPS O-acetylase OafA/YrhL
MRVPGSERLDQIDGLRAVAVLAVVGFHTLLGAWHGGRAPLWVACGARGVDLFFAISGFCLAYPFLRARRLDGTTGIAYGAFLARRLSRIAPPYWIALLGFAVLGLSGFGFPTAAGAHGGADVLRELGLDAIFLTSPSPTFDASFWTIGIEMRWYLLFPLLLGLYMRSRAAFGALGLACWIAYFFGPLGVADEGTLPCFMLGIVAADMCLARLRVRRYALGAGALTLALAVGLQARSAGVDHGDPIWQIAAFLILVAATGGVLARVLRWAPLRLVGIASFSIYLVHQPILQWLEGVGIAPWSSAVAALACGFGFYYAVERPFFDEGVRAPMEAGLRRLGDLVPRKRRAGTPVLPR